MLRERRRGGDKKIPGLPAEFSNRVVRRWLARKRISCAQLFIFWRENSFIIRALIQLLGDDFLSFASDALAYESDKWVKSTLWARCIDDLDMADRKYIGIRNG